MRVPQQSSCLDRNIRLMKTSPLGQELIAAVKDALHKKGSGRIVHPKINIASVRKKLGMIQTCKL